MQGARERQRARFTGAGLVRKYCQTDDSAQSLLKAAMQQPHLSARALHRTLKLARTIADLAGIEQIGAVHAAEALRFSGPVCPGDKLSA